MKKKINNYLRIAIQILFFLLMPSVFTTAFSGAKYIFTQIGNEQAIAMTPFVTVLIVLCAYTIVFGRFFCGFACAFGSVGDWIHEIYIFICKKAKKKPVTISEKIRKKLSYLKYIILTAIVLACFFGVYSKTKGWSLSITLSRWVSAFSTTVERLPMVSDRSVNRVKWSHRMRAPKETASLASMVPLVHTSRVSLS